MNLIELYCDVDDFLKIFLKSWNKQLISSGEKRRIRNSRLSISEIITILIFFHTSRIRDFKHYYLLQICGELRTYFPQALSYSRFVALIPTVVVPLCAYLQSRKQITSGISFVDSTSITVCHSKRIYGHKVFKNFAKLGKSTKGWFYGFKLHLICNHDGELVSCKFTAGNVDDRKPLPDLTKNMYGRLFDKIMLHKRSMIESINNQLKNVFHLEHSRHRSPINGFMNMLSAVIAYTHHANKPSIGLSKKEVVMLTKLTA